MKSLYIFLLSYKSKVNYWANTYVLLYQVRRKRMSLFCLILFTKLIGWFVWCLHAFSNVGYVGDIDLFACVCHVLAVLKAATHLAKVMVETSRPWLKLCRSTRTHCAPCTLPELGQSWVSYPHTPCVCMF